MWRLCLLQCLKTILAPLFLERKELIENQRNSKIRSWSLQVRLTWYLSKFLPSRKEDETGSLTLSATDVDGLYNCLAKALILLGSVNSQFKAQRREQVLNKLNLWMSS